jgi:hypothetical protein
MPTRSRAKTKPKRQAVRTSAKRKAVSTKRKTVTARKKPKGKLKVKTRHPQARIKTLGRVTHYYDRIGVAIVELAAPMRLGDLVYLKHGDSAALQSVSSLQIDHTPISTAKRGDVVGLKVDVPVREGTLVLPSP